MAVLPETMLPLLHGRFRLWMTVVGRGCALLVSGRDASRREEVRRHLAGQTRMRLDAVLNMGVMKRENFGS